MRGDCVVGVCPVAFTLCITQGRTTSPKTGAELSSEGYFARCGIVCAEVQRVMLRSHSHSQSRPALEDTGVAGGETRQMMSGGVHRSRVHRVRYLGAARR